MPPWKIPHRILTSPSLSLLLSFIIFVIIIIIISAILRSLVLSKSKYRIILILPSTKFMQCQVVVRTALKSSLNSAINFLWSSSSVNCNIQYDQFRITKQVFNTIENDDKDLNRHELKSQGFILSSIFHHASTNTRSLWSKVQKNMPKSIFNFTIKYLNNTLSTKKYLCKWPLSSTSSCSFCFQSETLQHIVSSCKSYVDDGWYAWRHFFRILLNLCHQLRISHYILIFLLYHLRL